MSGTIAAVAAAAVLALIAFVVVRRRKRQPGEWDTAPAALGMEPVGALDPALTAAIIALHRPPAARRHHQQTWSLTRIYRYPEPGVDLLLRDGPSRTDGRGLAARPDRCAPNRARRAWWPLSRRGPCRRRGCN